MAPNSAERVLVLVDGSNLYNKLRDRQVAATRLLDFDYAGLAQWLSAGRTVVKMKYYVGVVRAEVGNTKSEDMRRNQQRLFAKLKNTGWVVEYGFLMKNGASYYEKGVDVKMAVDLVAGAYNNTYDTAILISSDSDLIPAVQEARVKGKRVEYIGFSHQPSMAMIKRCSSSRLLTRADLESFIAK